MICRVNYLIQKLKYFQIYQCVIIYNMMLNYIVQIINNIDEIRSLDLKLYRIGH